MAKVWATRIRALPWGVKEGARALRAWIRREPGIREAALRFAREQAKAGDPASVLRCLDRFAREHRFLMNVGDEKGPLLEDLVRDAGPAARILELGTFVGYSAVLMGQHLGEGGALTSIDVSAESGRVGAEMAALAGLADRTHFLTGRSSEVIATLDEAFDLVFLDHWKPLYRRDLEAILARDLLREGAVVVADNVGPFFGESEYLPWMQARDDFQSRLVESHIEYQEIEDAVLISRWSGARRA